MDPYNALGVTCGFTLHRRINSLTVRFYTINAFVRLEIISFNGGVTRVVYNNNNNNTNINNSHVGSNVLLWIGTLSNYIIETSVCGWWREEGKKHAFRYNSFGVGSKWKCVNVFFFILLRLREIKKKNRQLLLCNSVFL